MTGKCQKYSENIIIDYNKYLRSLSYLSYLITEKQRKKNIKKKKKILKIIYNQQVVHGNQVYIEIIIM